jgi:hypothetical protein
MHTYATCLGYIFPTYCFWLDDTKCKQSVRQFSSTLTTIFNLVPDAAADKWTVDEIASVQQSRQTFSRYLAHSLGLQMVVLWSFDHQPYPNSFDCLLDARHIHFSLQHLGEYL